MHTTLKNVEILKHFKISKTAPTCFGLQGNHHQGATISTRLKITHLVKGRYVEAVQDVVSVMAAYCDMWGVCTVHCARYTVHMFLAPLAHHQGVRLHQLVAKPYCILHSSVYCRWQNVQATYWCSCTLWWWASGARNMWRGCKLKH